MQALIKDLPELLKSGLAPDRALRTLAARSRHKASREALQEVAFSLESGMNWHQALSGQNVWSLNKMELAMIKAGEISGKMPEFLLQIEQLRRERRKALLEFLLGLAYPAFVLHFLLLASPAQDLQTLVQHWDWIGFIAAKAARLLPFYAFGLGCYCLWITVPAMTWERWMLQLPLVRSLWRAKICARLSSLMRALVQTDLTMDVIWETAAEGAGSPMLEAETKRWKIAFASGRSPEIENSQILASQFMDRYRTAEDSGRMAEAFSELEEHFTEQYERLRRLALVILSVGAYLMTVLIVAWTVIQMYLGYFDRIFKV
jgi:type II secretory pathway component PulF